MKAKNIKQPIGAIIVTWLEIILAAACVVLFFFPVFKFLDGDMFSKVTMSQFRMLFGGSFDCGEISNQVVRADGNISFLVGFLVPMFMVVILYFRRIIRPFFAYLLHALISIALLFYLFSTCSVAAAIVRMNSEVINTYKLTWTWYTIAILVFLSLLLSVLLIVFDIYRLKNRQKDFTEHESDGQDDEASEEDNEEALEEAVASEEDISVNDEGINRSVVDAISESTAEKEPEEREKPTAHLGTEEEHIDLSKVAEVSACIPKEPEVESAPKQERVAVKVKPKPKAKPAVSENNSKRYERPRSSNYDYRSRTAQSAQSRKLSSRARIAEDDFDENSGY